MTALAVEEKLAILAADTGLDRTDAHGGPPLPSFPCAGAPVPAEAAFPPPVDSVSPTAPVSVEETTAGSRRKRRSAKNAGGLLQVLQSNECIHDCAFCPWRAGREVTRATLEPDELAVAFDSAHRAGAVSGLRLDSGVARSGPDSMDRLLHTATLLRNRYGFEGYLHLKVLPGAERAQLQAAMSLADRVSLNLEAPTAERLATLTSEKSFDGLLERLGWLRDLQAEFPLQSGVATQMVFGAGGETDRELLAMAQRLYAELGVRRVYLSPFRPVLATPLEGAAPPSPLRQARLAQAELLIRRYGMAGDDLAFGPDDHLAAYVDPKMAWALSHPERFPVEVNTATFEELIRVPGVGPLSARRLLHRRRERLVRDPREIALCGAIFRRAAPFLTLNGHATGNLEQFVRQELRRLQDRPAVQLPLWDAPS